MSCKHKFKIHEVYWSALATTGAITEKRAIVVCEKCALVKDVKVENENK